MKKIIAFLFVAFAVTTQGQTEMSAKYDYIGKFNNGIAFVRTNGLVGVINSEGKEIIKPEWEKISGFGDDGVAYCYKATGVGLINREGVLLAQPIYERIGMFHLGRAIVLKNGHEGLIDKTGKQLLEPKYDKLKVEEGGIVRATENGKQQLLRVDQ